jgi:hypothetical protein
VAELLADELIVADDPAGWERIGFGVHDGVCQVGTVRIRLTGADSGRGLLSWAVRGLAPDAELDGLRIVPSDAPPRERGPAHPNGSTEVDHVVAFTPDLDRTVARLEAAGFDLRRVREEPTPAGAPRQAFFRVGEPILEVVQQPEDRIRDRDAPARLWGLAFVTEDIDRAAEHLGEHSGGPRDAVQPGRRIATLRRGAGLSVPIAFMTPR